MGVVPQDCSLLILKFGYFHLFHFTIIEMKPLSLIFPHISTPCLREGPALFLMGTIP